MTSTRGIDFSRLSLCDALDLAILIEEEARERYEELAEQLELHHTPEAAAFFRFMSQNEEKHRAKLAERRKRLFPDAPCSVTREMLFDVEAPEYHEAHTFMTVRQAFEAALRSEQKALAFFTDSLAHVTDPEVRKAFEELRGEEAEHEGLLKVELGKLPPEPALKAEDVADEPVGH